jgi:hypothetical protein
VTVRYPRSRLGERYALELVGTQSIPPSDAKPGAQGLGSRNEVAERAAETGAEEMAAPEEQAGGATTPVSSQGLLKNASQIGWPDPPKSQAFHGLAGDFVRTVEPHSEADQVALLTQLLVGIENVVGRGPHFMVEADRHAPNLFVVEVGVTSKGRKGMSWNRVKAALQRVDAAWVDNKIISGLSSGEGLIWQVRDSNDAEECAEENPFAPGAGVADKRLLVFEGEFSSVLKVAVRQGSTLSATLRQAYDCGDLRILTKNSPAKATGAHISIVGHITRDELRRHLN